MTDLSSDSELVPAPKLPPLQGDERFAGVDATVLDFWRFAMSDLRMNNTRGYLAEFLVARALGVDARRVEWDDYDVLWGVVKIEVKSSAYLQPWPQRAPSQIKFSGLRRRSWDDTTAKRSEDKTYKADVYVLSVHTTRHHDLYDPLDVSSWAFYVLPRARLAELNVESLSLATVAGITAPVDYGGLAWAIAEAAWGTPQYWRRHGTYFKFTGVREYILRPDGWVLYDVSKSGPSWWRVSGEVDAEIINETDLPPGTPR